MRNYPQSVLVKMICDQYKMHRTSAQQDAMVQYNLLQEVSQAYSLKVSKSHYMFRFFKKSSSTCTFLP